MYETEANTRVEDSQQVPGSVLSALSGLKDTIVARTVLPWGEHCTECVWPSCYSTCELYSPREDSGCRRFIDGMVKVPCPEALNSYLLKIRFKRWGKLWAPANIRLRDVEDAQRIERRDQYIASIIHLVPPGRAKQFATTKRYGFKKRVAQRPSPRGSEPTSFLLECYNPDDQVVRLSLTMRSFNQGQRIPYQSLIEAGPGFTRVRVPVEPIARVLDLYSPFHVEIIPNDVPDGTTLYFGLMDFVRETQPILHSRGPKEKTPKVKCIVWDLDNTIWSGILVEDGPEKIELKPHIREVLQELDRLGILHSIASKNNQEEATQVLRRFKIEEFFLCPQISWRPKSEAIQAIAQQLNIGIDSLLFVDDSRFEIEQVKAVCPEVRVLNAEHYQGIPTMPECQVPVTEESANRRKLYKLESERQAVADGFGQDYFSFLKYCDIRLKIRPMTDQSLERVHELTQRTNQMNFSGNRYDRDVLRKIMSNSSLDTYVLDCEDRFGSYGTIGFGIVEHREPRLTDLMFSCRIQSKRVEHSFLTYILRKYIGESGRDFWANYRKTPRNAPSGKVFDDVGMEEVEVIDGVSSLRFAKEKEVPDDGLIYVMVETELVLPVGS